jgi:putative ABC transport system ATP-binding protein/macrolide transport system ATP-binding/permease protein/lipoprotein-releasing system ATP-binding protein
LAQSLSKRYGTAPGYIAVRSASLDVQAGDFVAIVGRSGSGKSTFLAMLGALANPTHGKVLFEGADIWTLSENELARFRSRHIGFVFQFPSLLSSLTAVDNVALPALLGQTMQAEKAYARAYDLLARIGLADRADAYPVSMSGGEQRRVAIARALINSPALLLADEPTSDLDEDTETDIIALLIELQCKHAFGFVLVTHNLQVAKRAQRSYEMRDGELAAIDLPQVAVPAERARVFGPPTIALASTQATGMFVPPPKRVQLGDNLWRGVQVFLPAAAVILAAILLADFGVQKLQAMRAQERVTRIAALRHLALNSLRGEVQSVTDLGDGRYELTTYLQNVGDGAPVYVMTSDMRAYVQVKTAWQELPMQPVDQSVDRVVSITSTQTYRYLFDARVSDFAQLLPNYMHIRFAETMLVSPSSLPKGDIFERKDNYYVYLKPSALVDDVAARGMRFSGKPPVWIPMPAH